MKKKIIIAIFLFLLLIFIVISSFLFIINKYPTANRVFTNNIHSIVELKSVSSEVGNSFGTAEFIKNDGVLITNAHVVTYKKLDEIYTYDEYFIRFANEDEYRQVELLKYNRDLDLATLRLVDLNCDFSTIKIYDGSISRGDTVFAIGNSLNYGLTISKGIIGVPLVEINSSEINMKVIQCDLTITEGNSGGALLNRQGELIGITTFRTKDYNGEIVYGLAYCIPLSIIMQFLNS